MTTQRVSVSDHSPARNFGGPYARVVYSQGEATRTLAALRQRAHDLEQPHGTMVTTRPTTHRDAYHATPQRQTMHFHGCRGTATVRAAARTTTGIRTQASNREGSAWCDVARTSVAGEGPQRTLDEAIVLRYTRVQQQCERLPKASEVRHHTAVQTRTINRWVTQYRRVGR